MSSSAHQSGGEGGTAVYSTRCSPAIGGSWSTTRAWRTTTASFVTLNTVRSCVCTTGPSYTARSSEKIRGITWGVRKVWMRPAMRGRTSPNTLPAAGGVVWAALSAIVTCSIESPLAAASAAAGGKHSWMSRSTPPSQARTSGQPARVSPEWTNVSPPKSKR